MLPGVDREPSALLRYCLILVTEREFEIYILEKVHLVFRDDLQGFFFVFWIYFKFNLLYSM